MAASKPLFQTHEFWIDGLGGCAIGRIRQLWRIVSSEFMSAPILHYASTISARVSAEKDALIAAGVIGACLAIDGILGSGGFAKIVPFVVGLIAIRMIDKFLGPVACHHGPDDSMCAYLAAHSKIHLNVAVATERAGDISRFHLSYRNAPSDDARSGIVGETALEFGDRRKIFGHIEMIPQAMA